MIGRLKGIIVAATWRLVVGLSYLILMHFMFLLTGSMSSLRKVTPNPRSSMSMTAIAEFVLVMRPGVIP